MADWEEALARFFGVRLYVLGCFYLALISVLWSLASYLVQYMKNDDSVDFNSPFFLTCYCTNLFMVFIPLSEWKAMLSFAAAKSVRCCSFSSSSYNSPTAPTSSWPSPEVKLAVPLSLLWFGANYLYALSLTLTSITSSTILATLGSVFAYLFGVVLFGVEKDDATTTTTPSSSQTSSSSSSSNHRPSQSPSGDQSFILATLGEEGDLRHLDVVNGSSSWSLSDVIDDASEHDQTTSLLAKRNRDPERESTAATSGASSASKEEGEEQQPGATVRPTSILKGGRRSSGVQYSETDKHEPASTTSGLPAASPFSSLLPSPFTSTSSSSSSSSDSLSSSKSPFFSFINFLARRRKLLGVLLTFAGGLLVTLVDYEKSVDSESSSPSPSVSTFAPSPSPADQQPAMRLTKEDEEGGNDTIMASPVFGDIAGLLSAAGYGAYTTYIKAATSSNSRASSPSSYSSSPSLGGGSLSSSFPHRSSEHDRPRPISVRLLLGYVGLVNFLLFSCGLYPLLLLLKLTPSLSSLNLTTEVLLLLTVKGLLDNVLSDYLWARAVVLCGPVAASIGLGLTVPVAGARDAVTGAWNGETTRVIAGKILGGALVVAGFVAVNYGQGH